MNKNDFITVEQMAEYLGRTRQYVYNKLKSGEISGIDYTRGSMQGWLVERPVNYDEWVKNKEQTNEV